MRELKKAWLWAVNAANAIELAQEIID